MQASFSKKELVPFFVPMRYIRSISYFIISYYLIYIY